MNQLLADVEKMKDNSEINPYLPNWMKTELYQKYHTNKMLLRNIQGILWAVIDDDLFNEHKYEFTFDLFDIPRLEACKKHNGFVVYTCSKSDFESKYRYGMYAAWPCEVWKTLFCTPRRKPKYFDINSIKVPTDPPKYFDINSIKVPTDPDKIISKYKNLL